MKEFSKKLLGIYGTIFFGVSLLVFYIIFKAYYFFNSVAFSTTSSSFDLFYLIAITMLMCYVSFIGAVIYSIIQGKKEDLRLQSALEYANWRLE